MEIRKFFAEVQNDSSLNERQIRVIANSGKADRVKDVLVAAGCKTDNYTKNPIVLADHDRSAPIGNFAPEIKDGAVVGVITFAPHGISAKADEYCGLYKSGVMKSVSVGFRPIKFEPVDKNEPYGGLRFDEWELLELSCVAVPCDAAAVVTQRALPTAQWKCGASLNLPLATDVEFDAEKAAAEIFAHCGFDGDKPDSNLARKAFLVYDAARPLEKDAYHMPFATVVEGRLMAIPRALLSIHPAQKMEISDDCMIKATAVLAHYEKAPTFNEREAILAEFKALPIDDLRALKFLSTANTASVNGLGKCMAAMSDAHVKALDSHGATHEQLTNFAMQLSAAGEHMKALKAAGKKKPKPAPDSGGDVDPDPDDGDGDDDVDPELAFEAERVKAAAARARQIEIAKRA